MTCFTPVLVPFYAQYTIKEKACLLLSLGLHNSIYLHWGVVVGKQKGNDVCSIQKGLKHNFNKDALNCINHKPRKAERYNKNPARKRYP